MISILEQSEKTEHLQSYHQNNEFDFKYNNKFSMKFSNLTNDLSQVSLNG